MIQEDITKNKDLINQALEWADKYGKESFPREELKNYRRQLKRITEALSENCSAAAYGESQVGKSYLMSSLLSSPNSPFEICNNGKKYSFIDEINPSGGNNTKKESTGVVTRFTIRPGSAKTSEYVKITNLSVVDIILMLADSYYNDVKIEPDKVLMHDEINARLSKMSDKWRKDVVRQNIITEDDIKDICDYLTEIIGNPAVNICKSNFCKIVSQAISYILPEEWSNVFGLLWNNNEEINLLFNKLIAEYGKIGYMTEVYVPFDAVLRSKGTILKIDWLDGIFGQSDINPSEEQYTDVYDSEGNLVKENFSKAYLSALAAELTFVLSPAIAEERPFLKKIDLLDFPGARSRRHYGEYDELKKVLPTILRRGKVAYLFNKYSRSLKISAVLFCHHNDQGTEATIGNSIDSWIRTNIGNTQDKRAAMLSKTNGIAPLFFVCTKFNIDLERTKVDMSNSDLDGHWARFNTIIPEIIKPAKWLDEWVTKGGIFSSQHFRNVYLLRDFYWSAKNGVFDGYDEKERSVEKCVHVYKDYPEYFDDLKKSFLRNSFVKKHFADPEQAWNDVATVNNDGSKAIIRNLNSIAEVLDDARRDRYAQELTSIRNDVANKLNAYYEPDDPEKNNERVRKIIGDIKIGTDFKFGSNPELFGRIIDNMMVSPADLRTIAYDIIIRHVEVPQSVSSIITIRASAGIDLNDKRENNIRKLTETYNKDEQELKAFFSSNGISLEDVISDDNELLSTVPSVITRHIINFWTAHMNAQAKKMGETLPHADEITFMILTLLDKLGVRKSISDRISHYYDVLDRSIVSNAIADYAALTLNNFVSTAGRGYMSDADISYVTKKSAACNLEIDLSPASSGSDVRRQPLLEVLAALDQSGTEINNRAIDFTTLQKLPFWSSYRRWQNYITIGLLYTSEISQTDPVANKAIKNIIEQNETLYI